MRLSLYYIDKMTSRASAGTLLYTVLWLASCHGAANSTVLLVHLCGKDCLPQEVCSFIF